VGLLLDFCPKPFCKTLIVKGSKKGLIQGIQNPSKSEEAYLIIDEAVSLILSEFGIAV
jgi:hypothetical protein